MISLLMMMCSSVTAPEYSLDDFQMGPVAPKQGEGGSTEPITNLRLRCGLPIGARTACPRVVQHSRFTRTSSPRSENLR